MAFVVALTTIGIVTVAGIVLVALLVKDATVAIVLIGAITAFATSVGASVAGLFSLLFQVRGEMNHRFDQLVEAKTNLGYNAGLDAADAGDMTRRGDNI